MTLPGNGWPVAGSTIETGRPERVARLREVAARARAASASAPTACWRCDRSSAGSRETCSGPFAAAGAGSSAARRTTRRSACRCTTASASAWPVNENGPRVERGVAEQDADAAVVERPRVAAVVAERGQLRERRRRAVVHAAVDQEAVGRALTRGRRRRPTGSFTIARCRRTCSPARAEIRRAAPPRGAGALAAGAAARRRTRPARSPGPQAPACSGAAAAAGRASSPRTAAASAPTSIAGASGAMVIVAAERREPEHLDAHRPRRRRRGRPGGRRRPDR